MLDIAFKILLFPVKFLGNAVKDWIYSWIVKIVWFITILTTIIYIFNWKL